MKNMHLNNGLETLGYSTLCAFVIGGAWKLGEMAVDAIKAHRTVTKATAAAIDDESECDDWTPTPDAYEYTEEEA